MTFVYPLLLGGLILAGLPVLLHFLIRQKPRTLLFPAFQFLMQKQRTNTRKLRLRHLLLLLLRIALVVLACLALARPRLLMDQIGIDRERPVTLVMVFDTSPSMDYKSNETTRLEVARKRSLELLDQLPEDCRVLIVDSGDVGASEDWLPSLAKARQKIDSLASRPAGVPITQAILEALRRVDDWDRQGEDAVGLSYPRFLCVFSDRTQSSWDPSEAATIQKFLERVRDVKLQTLFFDVGVDEPVDTAITQLTLPAAPDGSTHETFAAGEKIRLHALVKATGKDSEIPVECVVAGRKLAEPVSAKADVEQPVTFEIDSEKLALQPGAYQAVVKLATAADALSFDNQRFITFKVRAQSKILVLADDVKKAQSFKRALEALLHVVEVRSVKDKGNLALADYSCVFLDGVPAPEKSLWEALAKYLQGGGGLGIVPPGDDLQRESYNSDAAQAVMPGRIVAKVTAKDAGFTWDPLSADLLHPFLLPYRAWFLQRNNDIILRPCVATDFWQVAEPKGRADVTVVMRYEEPIRGRPAVIERRWPKTSGKVILLTTPLDDRQPEWNNYHQSLNSFYLGLTMLCSRYLNKETKEPRLNWLFGPAPPSLSRPILAYKKYVLTGPDFTEEIRFDDEGRWLADHLPRAGNYRLTGTNADRDDPIAHFSVNVPGAESDLTRLPAATIEATLGKNALIAPERGVALRDALRDYWNEPMELFPWLMIAILFFLALENLLANRFYRQDAEP